MIVAKPNRNSSAATASMWCPDCQQEVPGIASHDDEHRVLCARCGIALSAVAGGAFMSTKLAGCSADDECSESGMIETPQVAPPPIKLDDWELDEQLRRAEQIVKSVRHSDGISTQPNVDPAHEAIVGWHARVAESRRLEDYLPAPVEESHPKRRGNLFSWSLLSLGMMCLVCGGVLLGWSIVGSRPDLWSIGLPLALAGQAGLLIGFVLQLDGLWQNSRRTTDTLSNLDERLSELRTATSLLSTTHGGPAQSFYAHMAEGASPHLLVADLKGQIDMLAVRMANERR